MYMIEDLQIQGRYFADEEIFKSKTEVLNQLIDYHNVDFTGTDNNENILTIEEFLEYHNINSLHRKLDWILNYGQWEIVEINKDVITKGE